MAGSEERQRLIPNGDDDEPDYLFEDNGTRAEQTGANRSDIFTYEEAIADMGYGCWHVLLLLLCGWAVSSDAVEVLSISFVLPSATCDLELGSFEKGLLNSIVFVGMMVGGYVWGSLADRSGRRSVLLWSLTVNGMGMLLSSGAQVFWLFLLMRFFSGVGVGGSIPVIFSYFTEFQPKERRGTMISVLATFWMCGNIIAAGLAWLVIPHTELGYFSPDFTYDSWRIFVALCTVPSFSSAALFVLMPESPKFLLQKGKDLEAVAVFQRIHHRNKPNETFRIKRLVMSEAEKTLPGDLVVEDGKTACQPPARAAPERGGLRTMLSSTIKLFRPPLRTVTVVLLIINFALAFGYYGLFMWFPELFSRIEKYGGTPCDPGGQGGENGTTPDNSTLPCTPNDWVFFEGFMTAVSNLPGNILSIFLMDRLGRKLLLTSSMLLSGLSVFLLWFVKNRVQNLAMSCLFGAVSTIAFNALDVLQTELFPTDVRSTAFGVQTGIARIAAILGNLAFGVLVDVHCAVPMLMVASLLTLGGLTAIKLPNTTRRDIH